MSLTVEHRENLSGALVNPKLSYRAKGILAFLTLLGDSDDISIDFLLTNSSEGRTAVRSALSTLEKNGFLRVTRNRDERGAYGSANWLVDCSGELTLGD